MSIVFGQVSKPVSRKLKNAFGMVLLEPMANVKVTYGPDKINNFLIDFKRKRDRPFLIYYPMRCLLMGRMQLLRSTKPILPK